MPLHTLVKTTPTKATRRGRGQGSRIGGKSGRGQKGQASRAGYGRRHGFEGGRMPLARTVKKLRGLRNLPKADKPKGINTRALEHAFNDGDIVSPKTLFAKGFITSAKQAVKILGDGALTKKLTIQGCTTSASAKKLIEEAGGSIQVRTSPKA